MMDLGTSKQTEDAVLKRSSGVVKNMKEIRAYQYRILSDFAEIREVFYPTVRSNEEGELRASWNVIRVGQNSSGALTPIIDLDTRHRKMIAKATGNEDDNIRSRLSPTYGFIALVFDRGEDELSIDKVAFKYSIVKKLMELQKKKMPTDTSKLMYGPLFTFDVIIDHKFDATKNGPAWTKHSYDVTAFPGGPFYGKLPDEIYSADVTPFQYIDNAGYIDKIFSEAELALIQEHESDLPEITRPHTEDEVAEQLRQFPINPFGIDKNGNGVFANPREIINELNRLELPAVSEADAVALSGGQPQASQPALPPATAPADAPTTEPAAETAVSQEASNTERPSFAKNL